MYTHHSAEYCHIRCFLNGSLVTTEMFDDIGVTDEEWIQLYRGDTIIKSDYYLILDTITKSDYHLILDVVDDTGHVATACDILTEDQFSDILNGVRRQLNES